MHQQASTVLAPRNTPQQHRKRPIYTFKNPCKLTSIKYSIKATSTRRNIPRVATLQLPTGPVTSGSLQKVALGKVPNYQGLVDPVEMLSSSIHSGLSCTSSIDAPSTGVGGVGCWVVSFVKFHLSTVRPWSMLITLAWLKAENPWRYQTIKTTLILYEWSRCKCNSRRMDFAMQTCVLDLLLRWLGKEKHVDNDFTLIYRGRTDQTSPKQNTSRLLFFNLKLNYKRCPRSSL